ncbi:hypothetical protein [Nodosilinea sp. E11]|uniref:hypothetical protein n=1 Tax=Nodosilinea sp. E11 TaxID=3037479 RepID=UPI00293473F8|nr:hypothetical protein [Nodosilinea sp. E11]WOD38915.1 hypothetical protein RRF56_22170 [Nodosilinea sp. E11]
MKNQTSKTWTADQLKNFSDALGNGYVPGMNGADEPNRDRWTTQRHLQASAMRAQAYL